MRNMINNIHPDLLRMSIVVLAEIHAMALFKLLLMPDKSLTLSFSSQTIAKVNSA